MAKNLFGVRLARAEDALPLNLKHLSKLKEFSAWGQGITHVVSPQSCPSDSQCELDYETAIEVIESNGTLPRIEMYHCPNRSWSANLDRLEAIYAWNNLEKFWIDACRLSATDVFFKRAAQAWPLLRSLDLYDNGYINVDAAALQAFSQHLTCGSSCLQEMACTAPFQWNLS